MSLENLILAALSFLATVITAWFMLRGRVSELRIEARKHQETLAADVEQKKAELTTQADLREEEILETIRVGMFERLETENTRLHGRIEKLETKTEQAETRHRQTLAAERKRADELEKKLETEIRERRQLQLLVQELRQEVAHLRLENERLRHRLEMSAARVGE